MQCVYFFSALKISVYKTARVKTAVPDRAPLEIVEPDFVRVLKNNLLFSISSASVNALRAENTSGMSTWSNNENCFSFLVEITGNLTSPKLELPSDCGGLMVSGKNEGESRKLQYNPQVCVLLPTQINQAAASFCWDCFQCLLVCF